MNENLKYYITTNTIPYYNLAREEYLLNSVAKNQVILYLWQNMRTVVIGKNQNAFNECRVDTLRSDNGHVVRRLSGGGAVYHDLGNLNFTFLVLDDMYDVDKQLDVITSAVKSMGLDAVRTGRNDIEIDGRKFSGNAFYKRKNRCYHHGTILIDVDKEDVDKYLNVSHDKLKAKAVDSVKKRIVNLKDLNKDITVENMTTALIEAFSKVYGSEAQAISECEINVKEVEELKNKFQSDDFIFGKKMKSDFLIKDRFPWGNVEINFNIEGNKVVDTVVYSDSMEWEFTNILEDKLKDMVFSKDSILSAFEKTKTELDNNIFNDIYDLIKSVEL